MSDPRWRGDPRQELAIRWLIRRLLPPGREGFTLEDLDLIVRVFRPEENRVGRLRLIEHKYGGAPLGLSKELTFGLLDALMRIADPLSLFYDGLYVLRTPKPPSWDADPSWIANVDKFLVQGVPLSRGEFTDWLRFEPVWNPPEPQPVPLEISRLLRPISHGACPYCGCGRTSHGRTT